MPLDPDSFREALAHWASGVAIVASRQDTGVVATTVSAFMSLSADPALVLIALGPNATIRPFLTQGAEFVVSMLAASQRRLAMVYADSYAVGPSPFASEGPPAVRDALTALTCVVTEAPEAAGHLLVTAEVLHADVRHGDAPLIRYLRRYHALPD